MKKQKQGQNLKACISSWSTLTYAKVVCSWSTLCCANLATHTRAITSTLLINIDPVLRKY